MPTLLRNKPLFVNQVLIEHIFGTRCTSFKRRSEYELRYAILEDAICCFQRASKNGRGRKQHLAHEAEEWLFTNDPTWPFSFANVCAVLGIDAEHLRDGLRRWQQQSLLRTPLHQQRRPHLSPKIIHEGADFACTGDNLDKADHRKIYTDKRRGNGEDIDADIRF
jgi:hypothetical protein